MTHVGLHEGVRSALEQQPDHVHEASGRGGNERGPPILEEGQGGRKARARPQRGGGGGGGCVRSSGASLLMRPAQSASAPCILGWVQRRVEHIYKWVRTLSWASRSAPPSMRARAAPIRL